MDDDSKLWDRSSTPNQPQVMPAVYDDDRIPFSSSGSPSSSFQSHNNSSSLSPPQRPASTQEVADDILDPSHAPVWGVAAALQFGVSVPHSQPQPPSEPSREGGVCPTMITYPDTPRSILRRPGSQSRNSGCRISFNDATASRGSDSDDSGMEPSLSYAEPLQSPGHSTNVSFEAPQSRADRPSPQRNAAPHISAPSDDEVTLDLPPRQHRSRSPALRSVSQDSDAEDVRTQPHTHHPQPELTLGRSRPSRGLRHPQRWPLAATPDDFDPPTEVISASRHPRPSSLDLDGEEQSSTVSDDFESPLKPAAASPSPHSHSIHDYEDPLTGMPPPPYARVVSPGMLAHHNSNSNSNSLAHDFLDFHTSSSSESADPPPLPYNAGWSVSTATGHDLPPEHHPGAHSPPANDCDSHASAAPHIASPTHGDHSMQSLYRNDVPENNDPPSKHRQKSRLTPSQRKSPHRGPRHHGMAAATVAVPAAVFFESLTADDLPRHLYNARAALGQVVHVKQHILLTGDDAEPDARVPATHRLGSGRRRRSSSNSSRLIDVVGPEGGASVAQRRRSDSSHRFSGGSGGVHAQYRTLCELQPRQSTSSSSSTELQNMASDPMTSSVASRLAPRRTSSMLSCTGQESPYGRQSTRSTSSSVMRKKLVVVTKRRKRHAAPSRDDTVVRMSLLPISAATDITKGRQLEKLIDCVAPHRTPSADPGEEGPRYVERLMFRHALASVSSRSASLQTSMTSANRTPRLTAGDDCTASRPSNSRRSCTPSPRSTNNRKGSGSACRPTRTIANGEWEAEGGVAPMPEAPPLRKKRGRKLEAPVSSKHHRRREGDAANDGVASVASHEAHQMNMHNHVLDVPVGDKKTHHLPPKSAHSLFGQSSAGITSVNIRMFPHLQAVSGPYIAFGDGDQEEANLPRYYINQPPSVGQSTGVVQKVAGMPIFVASPIIQPVIRERAHNDADPLILPRELVEGPALQPDSIEKFNVRRQPFVENAPPTGGFVREAERKETRSRSCQTTTCLNTETAGHLQQQTLGGMSAYAPPTVPGDGSGEFLSTDWKETLRASVHDRLKKQQQAYLMASAAAGAAGGAIAFTTGETEYVGGECLTKDTTRSITSRAATTPTKKTQQQKHVSAPSSLLAYRPLSDPAVAPISPSHEDCGCRKANQVQEVRHYSPPSTQTEHNIVKPQYHHHSPPQAPSGDDALKYPFDGNAFPEPGLLTQPKVPRARLPADLGTQRLSNPLSKVASKSLSVEKDERSHHQRHHHHHRSHTTTRDRRSATRESKARRGRNRDKGRRDTGSQRRRSLSSSRRSSHARSELLLSKRMSRESRDPVSPLPPALEVCAYNILTPCTEVEVTSPEEDHHHHHRSRHSSSKSRHKSWHTQHSKEKRQSSRHRSREGTNADPAHDSSTPRNMEHSHRRSRRSSRRTARDSSRRHKKEKERRREEKRARKQKRMTQKSLTGEEDRQGRARGSPAVDLPAGSSSGFARASHHYDPKERGDRGSARPRRDYYRSAHVNGSRSSSIGDSASWRGRGIFADSERERRRATIHEEPESSIYAPDQLASPDRYSSGPRIPSTSPFGSASSQTAAHISATHHLSTKWADYVQEAARASGTHGDQSFGSIRKYAVSYTPRSASTRHVPAAAFSRSSFIYDDGERRPDFSDAPYNKPTRSGRERRAAPFQDYRAATTRGPADGSVSPPTYRASTRQSSPPAIGATGSERIPMSNGEHHQRTPPPFYHGRRPPPPPPPPSPPVAYQVKEVIITDGPSVRRFTADVLRITRELQPYAFELT